MNQGGLQVIRNGCGRGSPAEAELPLVLHTGVERSVDPESAALSDVLSCLQREGAEHVT